MFNSIVKKIYISSFVLFAKLIKKFVVFRFGLIETRSIGHFSKPIDIFLAEKELGIIANKKKIDIWFTNSKISNSFLLYKWKKHLNIFPNFLISPLYTYFRKNKINDFLIPYRHWQDVHHLPLKKNPKWQMMDINKVLIKTKPKINLTKKEKIDCENELKNIGLNPEDKFFCFFARDNLYTSSSFKKKLSDKNTEEQKKWLDNADESQVRNFDINSYVDACNYMKTKNFKSVRIGSKVQDKINFDNSFLINYSESNIVSGKLDLYLAHRAEFFCGGDSGIIFLPTLFRKKAILINSQLYTINDLDDGFSDLIIFKKFYSNKKGKFLKYSELLNLIYSNEYILKNPNKKFLSSNDLSMVDNTKEEIKDLFIEYMERKNKIWVEKEDEKMLMEKVNTFMQKNSLEKINYLKIGYNFLKKNIELFE